MKKNSCTPINPKKYSCYGLKIHTRNLITKKYSCRSKNSPLPHNFSNGPSPSESDLLRLFRQACAMENAIEYRKLFYKCEEIRVSCFSKSSDVFDPIVLNGKQIEKISSWKVLGLNISADLRWNENVKAVCGNATSHLRFDFLLQLESASRSVFYVRSLNTLAKFLTNHYRSNSLGNKLFLFFVLVPTFSTNWPGNVCYAIYRSTCQTHYYSWLISTIR